MSNLILPRAVAAKRRPYAAAPLQDLLQELQLRGVLHELTVEEAMPPPEQLVELTDAQITSIRQSTLMHMLQQAVMALAKSPLLYTGTGYKPPLLAEFLVLKLLAVRHPMRPQPVEEPALVPEGGA